MQVLRNSLLLIVIAILGLAAPTSGSSAPPSNHAVQSAQEVLPFISLPDGFEITVFAENVPGARSLEWTPNGTLFVGSRGAGNVYALRDDNADGVADGVLTIASGLYQPNGVVFHEGDLYVAEVTRISRYGNIEANLNAPPQPTIITSGLPDTHHGWKFLRLGPDERLYFNIGAPCNICNADDPRFATISSVALDGSNLQIYANGVRNSVGFDWHPDSEELWFTDNGRDNMGDDIPPDELNRANAQGQHFGFPFCHGGTIPDPQFGALASCDQFLSPEQQLGPHVAALGMRFYTGESFPAEYQNQIFIAEHGSWNRTVPIGYRITLVRLDEEHNATNYEVFAEGWLQPNATLGRPVDIEQLPDGSLLVSDDHRGTIYRIAYTAPEDTPTP